MIVSVFAVLAVARFQGTPVTGLKLVSVSNGITRVNGVPVIGAMLPRTLYSGDRVSTLGTCLLERTAEKPNKEQAKSTCGKTLIAIRAGSVSVGTEVASVSEISTWSLELLKGSVSVQEPASQLNLYDMRLGLYPFKSLSALETVKVLQPLTIRKGDASFRSIAGIYGATVDERSLKVTHLIGVGTAFRGKSRNGIDSRREVIIPTSGMGVASRVSRASAEIMAGILSHLESAGVALRITAPPPMPMFRLNSLTGTAKCTASTGTYSRDVIPYFAFSPADVITHSGLGKIEHHGIDFGKSAFIMESPFSITYAGYGVEDVPDKFGFLGPRPFFMIESDDDTGSFKIREPASGTGTVNRPFIFKRKKKFSKVYGIGTEYEVTLQPNGLLVHCTKGKVGLVRRDSETSVTYKILCAGNSRVLTDSGDFGPVVPDTP